MSTKESEREITEIKAELYDLICDLQPMQAEYVAMGEKVKKFQDALRERGDRLRLKCKELETRQEMHVVDGKPFNKEG